VLRPGALTEVCASTGGICDLGQSEVIRLDIIERGALLVADTKYKGDYFVIDTIDNDMYLRVAAMNSR
jgi:hypothetical protein